jgi:hypothetical protein
MKADKIIIGVLGGVAVGVIREYCLHLKRRQNKNQKLDKSNDYAELKAN